jgi:hypothetical protein
MRTVDRSLRFLPPAPPIPQWPAPPPRPASFARTGKLEKGNGPSERGGPRLPTRREFESRSWEKPGWGRWVSRRRGSGADRDRPPGIPAPGGEHRRLLPRPEGRYPGEGRTAPPCRRSAQPEEPGKPGWRRSGAPSPDGTGPWPPCNRRDGCISGSLRSGSDPGR